MSGIGVITNPLSRKNKRNPRLAGQLGYILGERGDLQTPGDLDALVATARQFYDRDIDVLCINGGDGTIHKAMTAMVSVYGDKALPKVAILRGGTMNIVANSLGARTRPAEALDYVVRTYHAGAPMPLVRRNLMQIGDQYGFLFGNGIIARFLELYYEGGEPTPTKAAMVLGRGVLSTFVRGEYIRRLMRGFKGTVAVDGQEWPGTSWTAVAAGTVEQIGLGFQPFYDVAQYPGHFHAVGIGGTVLDLAWELPRVYFGRELTRPGNLGAVGKELVLRSDEPNGFMIDGDFHVGPPTLTVRVGPPVDFVVPDLAR